jgi:parallel beta-helix repeat protein
MRTEQRGRAAACVALAAAAWLVCEPRVVHAQPGATTTVVVSPTGAVRTVSEALRLAPAGGRITVKAGTYAEPLLRVTRPVTLEGEPGAVLDGGGTHTILEVVADDVTVRGLTLRNTGPSQSEERAGILVHDARGCRIEGNRFEQTLFAIYLAKVTDCLVQRNVVRGPESAQMVSGNGIHVWSSQRVQLVDNDVRRPPRRDLLRVRHRGRRGRRNVGRRARATACTSCSPTTAATRATPSSATTTALP